MHNMPTYNRPYPLFYLKMSESPVPMNPQFSPPYPPCRSRVRSKSRSSRISSNNCSSPRTKSKPHVCYYSTIKLDQRVISLRTFRNCPARPSGFDSNRLFPYELLCYDTIGPGKIPCFSCSAARRGCVVEMLMRLANCLCNR